jgi:hypothetical protein
MLFSIGGLPVAGQRQGDPHTEAATFAVCRYHRAAVHLRGALADGEAQPGAA